MLVLPVVRPVKKELNRQILVLKICSDILQMSPDKVEEADEIASLDENLKNNFSWVVILSEGQRQPGKRC